jgi:hypothetical protein
MEEQDPILAADARRRVMLEMTPLGRSALAEFARQADYTKYVVHQVTRGKNPRAILRNPNTGAWMEMSKLPQGYEVQEDGKVVKRQIQESQPSAGSSLPASVPFPPASDTIDARASSLSALKNAASHPELSNDAIEVAVRHHFKRLSPSQSMELAEKVGLAGTKNGKDAQNKVVQYFQLIKATIASHGLGASTGSQAALPAARFLVEHARAGTAFDRIQEQAHQEMHQSLVAAQKHEKDRENTLDNASALLHLSGTHRQQAVAREALGKSLSPATEPSQSHAVIREVAERNLEQAQAKRQQRDAALHSANAYARVANKEPVPVAVVTSDIPATGLQKAQERAQQHEDKRQQLMEEAKKLHDEADLHHRQSVNRSLGLAGAGPSLHPGSAGKQREHATKLRIQANEMLREAELHGKVRDAYLEHASSLGQHKVPAK